MKLISPTESKLAIFFPSIVKHGMNGPLFQLYPENGDSRYLLFKPFDYNYVVPIAVGGKRGGKEGHYHYFKQEVFCLLYGEVEVCLEDIVSKEVEKIKLSGLNAQKKYNYMLGIPPKIAHFIINSGTVPALLLVYSNQLPNDEDEIAYKVKT